MRYLVSSDWQFAPYKRLSTITADGITSRLQEFADCFRWMLRMAEEHEVDSLAILGDFFDDRVSVPLSVLDMTARLLTEAKDAGYITHLLVGNHDAALKNPNINSLRVFNGLAEVYDTPRVSDGLGFVPWYADRDRLSNACKEVRDNGADYLLSHIMVEGSVPMAKGVPVDLLYADDFNKVLLGDVHDPVQVEPNIQYIGAPLQINFGDAGGKRGVWVLDTDDETLDFVENTESPKFWNIDNAKDAKNFDKHGGPKDYVKIRIADAEEAEAAYEELSGYGLWVQSDTIKIPDVAPRLDVRTQDSTEDVLRKYCEHEGVKANEIEGLIALGMEIVEDAKA